MAQVSEMLLSLFLASPGHVRDWLLKKQKTSNSQLWEFLRLLVMFSRERDDSSLPWVQTNGGGRNQLNGGVSGVVVVFSFLFFF